MGFSGIGQVQRFALFNQRTHPVNLPPFLELVPNAFNHLVTPGIIHYFGDDGRAPRGQLVDGGHLQIGVITHGQRARYRGGGHHQQVRFQRGKVWFGFCFGLRCEFVAQRQPLSHAKAVLLVNDGQRQVFELHLVLNDRVRAHHQFGLAAGNQTQHLAPGLGFLAAREPGRGDAQGRQPAHQLGKVLLGQNFGRRHQRALPTRLHTNGGSQRRHHGFAGTYIALKQTVHGGGTRQVTRNFFAHAALRSGQRKRQGCQQLLGQGLAPWLGHGAKQRRAQTVARALGLQLRNLLR